MTLGAPGKKDSSEEFADYLGHWLKLILASIEDGNG